MWYRNSNSDNNKPSALDTTSSKIYNYIRKDYNLIQADEEVPEHWEWMENKVEKKDWETYMQVADHAEALDDVYAALTELAEMIEVG